MTQIPGVPLLQDVEPPENMVRSQLVCPMSLFLLAILGVKSRAFCLLFRRDRALQ